MISTSQQNTMLARIRYYLNFNEIFEFKFKFQNVVKFFIQIVNLNFLIFQDPAKEDPELKAKLEKNKEYYKKKTEEILQL